MTVCGTMSGRSKPEVLVLDMDELDKLIARAREAGLSEGDCKMLGALADTVAWLHQELDNKTLTVARLRSLFGLRTSEKTNDVVPPMEESGEGRGKDPAAEANGDGDPKLHRDSASPENKRKGHGRHGASDYRGAERVPVSHGSLQHGDGCPDCSQHRQTGKVYELGNPRTLVRVVGQAPLKATVYELQTLRCNLCGRVFAADPPPGVGDKKYDATAASMIGLLKYGTGLPFKRLERLEGNLGVPLPAATQWEVVSEAAKELEPVHAELIRQAAQGRVLHNDDTSMRVLALKEQIVREQESGEADRTGIFLSNITAEIDGGQRVALFFTGRQHAGENMADVLRQRATELGPPIQMCDGLDRNLPKELETVLGNCLAHGRRKFVQVVQSFPDECRHVLEALREVYANDDVAREQGMSAVERLRHHQQHSGPVMDDLRAWFDEVIETKRVEPNSSLGQAIRYMTKRWDKLTLFLRKPGAPLDNNLAYAARGITNVMPRPGLCRVTSRRAPVAGASVVPEAA